MAGFKTHITVSSCLGVGVGVGGYVAFAFPPDTCLLAAGLCGLAGMLPDLDSDSGVPLRESIAFASAVVPMMMIDRFQQLGWPPATMVLAGGLIYLFIRFVLGELLRRYTVHRGMFHSIPALAIVGLLGYLVSGSADMRIRYYISVALMAGFLSHLVLDEIWSVDLKHARLKKSFGTALKFWSDSLWGNVSCYAKLILLAALAFGDPMLMNQFEESVQTRGREIERTARETIHRVWR